MRFVHALYLALSLLFASRVFSLTDPTGHAMMDGDPALMAWTLQWESRALVRDPLHLYAGNTFYPYPRSVVLSEPIVPLALLNVPVRAITENPWVGYNLLIVAAFYLSCIWGAAFVREITGSEAAAVWGGIFWAFMFFRIHHIGHLQILSFQWVPLAMLCLLRLWKRPGVRTALLFVLAFVSQALVSWYLAVIVSVVLLITTLFRPRAETLSWPVAKSYMLIAALTAAIILPFALPYRTGLADSSLAQRRLAIDTFGDAVHVRDYLTPPSATLPGMLKRDNPYVIWGENTLYIGYVPLLLAAVAIGVALNRARARRGGAPSSGALDSPAAGIGRWTLTGLALVGAGYILALGFVSPGWGIRLPLHYAAHAWPILGALRATQRFSIVLYAGVLVLSGLGLAWIAAGRSRRWQIVATAIVCVAFLAEVFPFSLPLNPARPYVPSPHDRFIAQYQRTRPQPLVVLHLPIYYFSEPYPIDEATYMVDSTLHWARILNGFSGAEPVGFMERMKILNTLPDAPAVQLLRELGVDVVAVHGRAARSGNELREYFSHQDWSSVVPFPNDEFAVLIKR